MTQERPKGSPLHGKRVYAYIGQTSGTEMKFVSFATEFSLNLTAQNTARAVVMGSDAVPDVEIHGLVARLRLNLLLTSSEADFLLALGGVKTDADIGTQEVNYEEAVQKLLGRTGTFTNANRVDVIVAPLENAPVSDPNESITVTDLGALRSERGYIIELNSAAITSLEISGRIGEYTEARLEVESGRFKINAVEDTVD
ncbi:hypothetical protein LCGC14_1173130 [marine sediment metagenome]|uniref:Uncharacterized protein n=1 Tax=marine sediment metagenome TaxID=412755 RepID=A0A0F9LPE8_9ZZZZ